jgi:hypothetical protein
MNARARTHTQHLVHGHAVPASHFLSSHLEHHLHRPTSARAMLLSLATYAHDARHVSALCPSFLLSSHQCQHHHHHRHHPHHHYHHHEQHHHHHQVRYIDGDAIEASDVISAVLPVIFIASIYIVLARRIRQMRTPGASKGGGPQTGGGANDPFSFGKMKVSCRLASSSPTMPLLHISLHRLHAPVILLTLCDARRTSNACRTTSFAIDITHCCAPRASWSARTLAPLIFTSTTSLIDKPPHATRGSTETGRGETRGNNNSVLRRCWSC